MIFVILVWAIEMARLAFRIHKCGGDYGWLVRCGVQRRLRW